MVECEIWIDEFDAILRAVDGVDIEGADNLIAHPRFPVDDTDHLLLFCGSRIRLETCKIAGICVVPAIVLAAMHVLSGHFVP